MLMNNLIILDRFIDNDVLLIFKGHKIKLTFDFYICLGNPTDRYCDIMTVRDHMIARKVNILTQKYYYFRR